jgi:hypothetical protein
MPGITAGSPFQCLMRETDSNAANLCILRESNTRQHDGFTEPRTLNPETWQQLKTVVFGKSMR